MKDEKKLDLIHKGLMALGIMKNKNSADQERASFITNLLCGIVIIQKRKTNEKDRYYNTMTDIVSDVLCDTRLPLRSNEERQTAYDVLTHLCETNIGLIPDFGLAYLNGPRFFNIYASAVTKNKGSKCLT